MAYKKSSSCGGLRYSTTDFTEVDGVLTSAGNTELVGDPFLASMCGGIWFDDGVFGEVGKVITTAGTTAVENSFVANCSLLFDKDKFEIGEDKEIVLVAPPVPTLNYLCFTAEEAGSTISMSNDDGYAPEVSLETSINGVDWTPFVSGDTTITLANVGDKVYFRGDNECMAGYNEDDEDYYCNMFVMTGKIAASGNVMSLLDKTCESVTINSKYCFYNLFIHCASLTTAPELPATTLAIFCYNSMFTDCTSLTTPPELPATTLAEYCYYHMFSDCTSLTTTPELLATTLAEGCYVYMFGGCTSLYVSDTSGDGYDKEWNIPSEGVASGDYDMQDMFTNCLGTRSTDSPNFNGVQKTYYTQNVPV